MDGLLKNLQGGQMKEKPKKTQLLQWHPAFYAGIQIDLSEESFRLDFESEHQLGTRPKEIDVLIIKKNPEDKIHKNIGKIFRVHNIVEYKSPKDYLSIDDYYKVLGYACFYKADTPKEDAVKASEITVSLVCRNWPHKLIRHLADIRHLCLEEQEQGIYYIRGDIFPVQIICTAKLQPEKNIWLMALTNNLKQGEVVECLLKEYRKHQRNVLYKSVMNLIIRANKEIFEEEKEMCEALRELFKDELEVGIAAGIAERLPKMIEEQVKEQVEERVKEQVEERVKEQVEERVAEIVEERVAEAKREGIHAFIADNIEEGFPVSRILEKLEKRFGLTSENAQNYLKPFSV